MHKKIFEEIQNQKSRNVLLVLTGPTAAGKDALLNKFLLKHPHTEKIVTTTSRPMRETESERNPYHFVAREQFEEMVSEHAFYEWVEFRSDLYGTQKKTLENALKTGNDVVWKIEAKGVKNIKEKMEEAFPRSVFVFLTAPSVETMHERVERDEGKAEHHRWNEALVKWEMDQYDDSNYLVVNEEGKLDKTLEKVEAIMEAKRQEILD
jgi:guanylate kinase